MAFWLVKSEISVYSIDHLKSDGITLWTGVRNYQARNYLKAMHKGEQVLFYHSVDDPTGVVGLASVKGVAVADPSQFDKKSDYYEAKASVEEPRWFSPQLEFVRKFKQPLGLSLLKESPALKEMQLLKRGSRLSVQPVTELEFKTIIELADTLA